MKKQISVTIDDVVLSYIDDMAKNHDCSRSKVIESILTTYINMIRP
mgnify:CR=1 FL=1